jgi:hypothetical protein
VHVSVKLYNFVYMQYNSEDVKFSSVRHVDLTLSINQSTENSCMAL